MVYYLQQNVAILDQISHQIATIAPQVSIPSTPPPPFPSFKPLASDIRVNVFWFMALIFSLSAALLATLVQQWVRDYMHVFQRYSDPLKSARLRQYLHEGSEGWHMPIVADSVPGLLHVSLFLFFVGLSESALNINTAVGISTTSLIAIGGLLYIFTIFAPVIYPQSPYQNSFSGPIWYLVQKLGGRRYKDRGSDGASKSVSSNMAQGQMQLAMEETGDRKGRDGRAIRWLIGNMTEDAEMEPFVMAIPGSFNGEWGLEVWKKVSNEIEDENKIRSWNEPVVAPSTDINVTTAIPPVVRPSRPRTSWNVFDPIIRLVKTRSGCNSHTNTMALLPTSHLAHVQVHSTTTHVQGEDLLELSGRITHLLETCKNRGLFANDELWLRRTRGCIETTASLVCCAGAGLEQFGDIVKLLGDIGSDQKIHESSLMGRDQLFVMRWTCLSLMAIRPILKSNSTLHSDARQALQILEGEELYPVAIPTLDNRDTGGEQTLTSVLKIIETFDQASRCLKELYDAMICVETRTFAKAGEILRNHEPQISELEHFSIEDHGSQTANVDSWIVQVQRGIDQITHGIITRQLPGVKFEFDDQQTEPVHFRAALLGDRHQFTFPLQNINRIRTIALGPIRSILGGMGGTDEFQDTLEGLQKSIFLFEQQEHLLHRQVWHLQDLSDGGGLGFTIELFFLALRQLLSTSSSKESHSAPYIGTFRTITSDWNKYKHILGTQKLLLDMVAPDRGIISSFDYPAYITDEYLVLLGNILEGETGPHIDDIALQLTPYLNSHSSHNPLGAFYQKALGVITRARGSSS